MPGRIRRRLAYRKADQQEWKTIGEEGISAFSGPIVILGAPGLGKTVLTKTLGALPGMKRVTAGTFIRCADPKALIDEGDCIIVDGLDEIASEYPGGGLHTVLRQLSEMGYPRFILSCREADWRGAVALGEIKADYQTHPVLLYLQPFDMDDAKIFLAHKFPALDPDEVLEHLASCGLDGIYQNPLTLRLIGEVAQQEGPLPESRAGLLERSCTVMLTEANPQHQVDPHAEKGKDDLLLAAGALCAAQLLCDRIGVYIGDYASTPVGAVRLADVEKLPFGESALDSLRTRLFQGEDEKLFSHIHRVVAEYLGAKWLAHCVAEGISERQIFDLFRPDDGVPTSLRGLHAWIGHFNASLANRCIAADPYGLLLYGDTETLALEQARALLGALKNLSESDPYFASEDWRQHPASGLSRLELKEDVLAILDAPNPNVHLSGIVLNAMVGTELARDSDIAPRLEAIVFTPDRSYRERSCAADALQASGTVDDWDTILHRLLKLDNCDSASIACELLTKIGVNEVPIATSVEAVLSYVTFVEVARFGDLMITLPAIRKDDWSTARYIEVEEFCAEMFRTLQPPELIELLDAITSEVKHINPNGSSIRPVLATLVGCLMVWLLEAYTGLDPKKVWSWICWHDGNVIEPVRIKLAKLLRHTNALRAELQEYVLLTPCAENTLMAGHRLCNVQLELDPTHEDIVHLLAALRHRAGKGPIDESTWHGLLLLGKTKDGLPEVVREAAVEASNREPPLIAILNELSENSELSWMRERERHNAKVEAEREAEHQVSFQAYRNFHKERQDQVISGDYHILPSDVEQPPDNIRERIVRPDDTYMRLRQLSFDYVKEFEPHRDVLLTEAADKPDLIWHIRDRMEENSANVFSIDQMLFVVEAFAVRWPHFVTPDGITMGDQNPWDASWFIGQVIGAIASQPTPEATYALQRLIDGPAQSYANVVKHALAEQRKARRDSEYVVPSIEDLQRVMTNGVPESADGMCAYLLDALESLQEKMRGSNTNMWRTYWVDTLPRDENFCRDRLVEHLSGPFPSAIQIEPEAQMPEERKADFAISHKNIRVPIEIKGQWHREVWDAASNQLDKYYTPEVRAQDCGVYIVLWFGYVSDEDKHLQRHPENCPIPKTPEELRQMLVDRLPESRRSQIYVFVMDVSPPHRVD